MNFVNIADNIFQILSDFDNDVYQTEECTWIYMKSNIIFMKYIQVAMIHLGRTWNNIDVNLLKTLDYLLMTSIIIFLQYTSLELSWLNSNPVFSKGSVLCTCSVWFLNNSYSDFIFISLDSVGKNIPPKRHEYKKNL